KRSAISLFLSALAAGMILAMAAMSVALTSQAVESLNIPALKRFALALVYPLGFVVCLMSGNQLFTEHTATALYPVLDRKVKIRSLLALWFIVLAGNLVGALAISVILHQVGDLLNAKEGFLSAYHHFVSPDTGTIIFSSILAGWLMAQGGWLVLATPPASSQILCIFIVTFLIGFGGFHHSIAGSAEIFSGLLNAESPHYGEAFRALGLAILGNAVGGGVFVGILNYAHIRQTR
ncbi:MAG: formate/nitrite transporter family protein, partial [Halobacteriovoraceae bacterium]|nr:formate/nitrite transporter family protein [Halobacteriovoraceae bacterium]